LKSQKYENTSFKNFCELAYENSVTSSEAECQQMWEYQLNVCKALDLAALTAQRIL
jgi:hypothetical protein